MALSKKIKKAKLALKFVIEDKKMRKKGTEMYKQDKKEGKHIWLISERGTDAQDNGYHLYKYLLEHKEELGIHPIYVISYESKDHDKVTLLGGEVVTRGSKYHHLLLYRAEALISTHTYGYTPNMNVYYRMAQKDLFKPNGVQVFLSHGVTDKNISWLYRENFKPDMFVTSCHNEYDLARNTFKQPENVVFQTGMPRYDALLNAPSPKKQILIMPTWRVWLNGLSDEEFVKTNYYLFWQDLLNNKALHQAFKEKGYKVIFYLHPELKKRAHLFESNSYETRDTEIQQLMLDSEILITDYSSVFSDMAYMGRKIVFYQFDSNDYATKHYNGLITDYSKFGVVVNPSTDYANAIINKTLSEENPADQNYIQNEYFTHHDNKNCERVIGSIQLKISENK